MAAVVGVGVSTVLAVLALVASGPVRPAPFSGLLLYVVVCAGSTSSLGCGTVLTGVTSRNVPSVVE